MTESVIFSLSAMVFGPVVYDVVWERNPTNSFWNFWDTVTFLRFPSSGPLFLVVIQSTGYVSLPSSGCFHHLKHMMLSLAVLGECDIVYLPSLPVFLFQLSLSILERL